jgi:hypothetical protein
MLRKQSALMESQLSRSQQEQQSTALSHGHGRSLCGLFDTFENEQSCFGDLAAVICSMSWRSIILYFLGFAG